MIPPVPLMARLAMSAACLAVAKAGFALAGWISPELGTLNAGKSGIKAGRRKP